MSIIHDELNKLGISCDSISILQDKGAGYGAKKLMHGISHRIYI